MIGYIVREPFHHFARGALITAEQHAEHSKSGRHMDHHCTRVNLPDPKPAETVTADPVSVKGSPPVVTKVPSSEAGSSDSPK